jgi:Family of unknown function (DUF6503)
MKINKLFYILVLIFIETNILAQKIETIKGRDLLQKTIKYHDPKGNWPKLHQKIYFHAKEPKDTNIREEVLLDNRYSYFGHISRVDGKLIEKGIIDTTPYARINGDTAMSEADRKKYRLMPRQIRSARNSYIFLYGLPMKMMDKGVILNDTVTMDTFNKKQYLVLRAGFEKGIGNDSWFLYIHPKTFALEGYRFYHNRKPNDGEFIICEGMEVVQDIKIPKIRYWYSNENGEYGATDIVDRVEAWQYEQ